MKSPALLPLAGFGCLVLVSCTWLGLTKPKPKPAETAQSTIVGRIASIPQDRRFVLIQSYGPWTVATGSILVTHGPEDRTANLIATGEKTGQFAAADVQSGTLEVGDAVFFTPPPNTKNLSQPPDPPASKAQNAPIQKD